MPKLFKINQKQQVSLKTFASRRHKILIKRRVGGHGDVCMQRMMFEDFAHDFPQLEFHYAAPLQFSGMMNNHPFVINHNLDQIDDEHFGAVYDISTACRVFESKHPTTKVHRSDIWAAHCGIILKNHKTHFQIDPEIKKLCHAHLAQENPRNLPTVLIVSHSTTCNFGVGKTLTDQQIEQVVAGVKLRGYWPFVIHQDRLPIYDKLNVKQFNLLAPEYWVSLIDCADYMITIDTAAFHIRGGLGRPMTAVFTFTDGKTYGKYFDFILVQKHKDNGDWPCGPCFLCANCPFTQEWRKPCLTQLTGQDILKGFEQMVELNNIRQKI